MMQTTTTTPVSDMMANWLQSGGVQAAGADRLAIRISGDEMLSASAGTNSSAVWGCGAPADEAVMPATSGDEGLSAGAATMPGQMFCSPAPR
jgi:hypothetical protein